MHTQPFLVTVIAEPDNPLDTAALRGMRDRISKLLDIPPIQVACRPVLRSPDITAHMDGFPELRGALHTAPRLVIAMQPRPWDAWFQTNLIPYLVWPGDLEKEEDAQAVRQALSNEWLMPTLAGHLEVMLPNITRVVIVCEGTPCPAPEQGVLTIGMGPLSAWQEPAPDYVLRQSADVSIPVRDENTVVGITPSLAAISTTRTVPFRCSPVEEEDKNYLGSKSVGWTTLLDGVSPQVLEVATVLYSCYRRGIVHGSMTSLPQLLLAAAVHRIAPAMPVTILQHPKSLRIVQPHEAMERLIVDQMPGVTWDFTDPEAAIAAQPLVLDVLDTDWRFGESLQDFMAWIKMARGAAIEKTHVTGSEAVVAAAQETGCAESPDGPRFRMAPFPFWPSLS